MDGEGKQVLDSYVLRVFVGGGGRVGILCSPKSVVAQRHLQLGCPVSLLHFDAHQWPVLELQCSSWLSWI